MTTTRHALIIANDRYDDQGLGQLRAPAQDAVSLAEVLGDPEVGDFDVEVLRNERVDAIRRGIERFFSEGGREDTLMLHFSCHGLKSESGSLYFAARDTEPRLLEATAVSAQFVRHCMFRTRAKRTVLFLDCCYGGAFSRGSSSVRAAGDVHVLESFAGERLGGGRGWAVITASNSMEYAFEGTQLTRTAAPRPSVFTHAVVEGLTTGDADLDADGEVSLDELYEYVFDHVRQQSPHQTPGRTVDMQGDMYLAHSRRRRIVAKPVPPALRKAMDAANFYTRLGAVAELHAWTESTDLAKALGARDALEEIVQNDIRVVSDEARKALADSELRPDPVRLDFGRVPQHSETPHRPVHLLGPPLARACTPHPNPPAGDWLSAEESPEGLDIGVDTSRAGRLSGDLLLKGITGEVTLPVEAEIVPAPAPLPEPEPEPPPPPPPPPPSVRERAREATVSAGRQERSGGRSGIHTVPEGIGEGGVHGSPGHAVREGTGAGTGRAVPAGTEGGAPESGGAVGAPTAPPGVGADGDRPLPGGGHGGGAPAAPTGGGGKGHAVAPGAYGAPPAPKDTGGAGRAVPQGVHGHAPTITGEGGGHAVAPGPHGGGERPPPGDADDGERRTASDGTGGAGTRTVPERDGPGRGPRGRKWGRRRAADARAGQGEGGEAPARRHATAPSARAASTPAQESTPVQGPATGPQRAAVSVGAPRPAAGTGGRTRVQPSQRAPVLAGAGLVLAVASVGTAARAVYKGRSAVQALRDLKGDLGAHISDSGMLTALIVSLVTAAVALLLCALARRDLVLRPGRYPPSTASTTRSVVWTARLLAVPALVVGVVLAIAYPVANSIW
ncbi:caspase, EACC1-associated type [Streptomyces sp. NBC_00582]|uniref:caspase, EACC1-associated type n=1 Tax=Streptomyces sp. NBC_00582 TaxID=2975783 RepID=UPI0010631333|nr:caspase family protein [Streptomyces sp. NBC_00582]WUB60188.1 caspase family protein [Streptomyces sp. NBC_00582]